MTLGRPKHLFPWLLLALLLAVPGGAAAAPATGQATITLGSQSPAAKALRERGVRVGAGAPARRRGTKVRLPVRRLALGSSATAALGGSLRLSTRRRAVRLTALRMTLKGRRITIAGKLGRKRVKALTATGTPRLDRAGGTAALGAVPVRLTRAGARAMARRLGVRRPAAGVIGALTLAAAVKGAAGGVPDVPPPGGGPGGGAGGGDSGEPPLLARPATAVDVTSATITWHPKSSFIRYIETGEGTTVSAGATEDPPEPDPEDPTGNPTPYVYNFQFPFSNGWYDAASNTAGVYYGGAVNFSYQAHSIDMDTKEPEIELNGDASRAIFRMDGRAGSSFGNKRGVLVDLDPSAVTSTVSPDGKTFTWTKVPATIPEDSSSSVFAGFYLPGDSFGWVTFSYTTP